MKAKLAISFVFFSLLCRKTDFFFFFELSHFCIISINFLSLFLCQKDSMNRERQGRIGLWIKLSTFIKVQILLQLLFIKASQANISRLSERNYQFIFVRKKMDNISLMIKTENENTNLKTITQKWSLGMQMSKCGMKMNGEIILKRNLWRNTTKG
jgi:uncharacterized membrane protein